MNFALLHGGGQGSWVWNETIEALSAQSGDRANCLVLDVPGCGVKRTRDTSAIEFDEIARELNADVQAHSMGDVVLVGHSQAGMMIPRMVEFGPRLFRQLVYVSCSAPGRGMTILELMGNGVHGECEDKIGYPVSPKTSTAAEFFGSMFGNDMSPFCREAFIARLGQDNWPMSSYTYRDWRYDHLDSTSAMYVLCLQDMSLPPRWQERFAKTLRVQKTVRIDAGHQVMITRPQALAEILLGA